MSVCTIRLKVNLEGNTGLKHRHPLYALKMLLINYLQNFLLFLPQLTFHSLALPAVAARESIYPQMKFSDMNAFAFSATLEVILNFCYCCAQSYTQDRLSACLQ